MSINAGLAKGSVLWNNVKAIEEKSYAGQKFIVLILNDNENFINQLSGIKKISAKQNIQNLGSPIIINLKMLDIDKENLKSIISNYLTKENL